MTWILITICMLYIVHNLILIILISWFQPFPLLKLMNLAIQFLNFHDSNFNPFFIFWLELWLKDAPKRWKYQGKCSRLMALPAKRIRCWRSTLSLAGNRARKLRFSARVIKHPTRFPQTLYLLYETNLIRTSKEMDLIFATRPKFHWQK